MFLSDDIIINIFKPLLEFCHFIQLRAVNSHLCRLITSNLEENNQIIKKGTQLIILKGSFRIRGDVLLPFTEILRKQEIKSQHVIDEFNRKDYGRLFKFSDLEYARTNNASFRTESFLPPNNRNLITIKHTISDPNDDSAVCCANCKIDLILSPTQSKAWKEENGCVVGMVSNEYFDLVWHYDFLTGIRVYVNICTIM
ncbi:predicted protein [Naegleria gruberi]|uniref:Predicted protein n=1 Tax=Naegleria gruberi TaxID=5762 RepID=D2VG49_NAEGR|nr:uncharacterized protein NAEGRDRAFT_67852 [Naegleria gruberi]EFC44207.1 predicted protein [Naegleria gruberi]|eukprot:XP_002676951.1 predicted protein [Naegleria gruberi strain NEG-M]